jgi:hypothetical protein
LRKRKVCKAVAIICKKDLISFKISLDALQPLTDVGIYAGIRESDFPVLDIAFLELDALAAIGEDEVIRNALVIIQEVVFDDVRLVSKAQDELFVAKMCVVLHDMPEDWPVSNIDHGFGNIFSLLSDPHAQATTKQYDFH